DALFRFAARGDVDADTDHIGRLIEDHALAGEQARMALPALVDQLALDGGVPSGKRLFESLAQRRPTLLVEEVERVTAGDLLRRIARYLRELVIPAHQAPRAVDDVEQSGQRLDDGIGERLLAPQARFDAAALGDLALQRRVGFTQCGGAFLHGALELVARA